MKTTFQTSIIKTVSRKLKGPKIRSFRIVTTGIKDDTKRRILCPKF